MQGFCFTEFRSTGIMLTMANGQSNYYGYGQGLQYLCQGVYYNYPYPGCDYSTTGKWIL